MSTQVVYLITREDGMEYVGTTSLKRIRNRMKQHSKTDRFENFDFSYEVLFETEDYSECLAAETAYISVRGTYANGLNSTIDGQGNHLSENFTTKNYRFSSESREKMRMACKKRLERGEHPFLRKLRKGVVVSEAERKRLSEIAVHPINRNLTLGSFLEMKAEFDSGLHQENSGLVMKNGRSMSPEQAFALAVHEKYGTTVTTVRNLMKGRLPIWLKREIASSKS